MKKLLSILPLLASCALSANGQGYLLFSSVTQDLSIEKRISDVETGDYIDDHYVAQLFAGVQGSIESALTAVDTPVTFLGSPVEVMGEFLGNEIQIAGVGVGATATLQVRVWALADGASWAAAYAAALNDSTKHVGKSALFDLTLGALGSNVEMAPSMPLFQVQSVPEPHIVGLGIMGLGLSLAGRHLRKARKTGPSPAKA